MEWFAFDAEFYRANYQDVRHLDDEQAKRHYILHGMDEGRQASRYGTRDAFLHQIEAGQSVLEIGPFYSPLLTGPNVRYLDIFTRDQLIERARNENFDPSRIPEEIHYVGDLSSVSERFDAVVGSHSIEHQPDLAHHLQQVGRVLKPGGRYLLMIPDKRFCFDHFIPESTIADVLQAHVERRTIHTLGSVIEHVALTTHNDGARHWDGDHGTIRPADQDSRIDAAIELFERQPGAYIDVHAWYFTPAGFFNIVHSLFGRGLVTLYPAVTFPTPRPAFEFYAVLENRG